MASLNKVLLIGNLTRDPEIRYIPSGTAVADIGVAVSRKWTGQDGQKHEETTFVDVTIWARSAELAGEYLHKGDPIFIEGRLQLDQWQDKEGQKRSRMRVVSERWQFLPRGGAGGGRGGASAATAEDRPPPPEEFGEPAPAAAAGGDNIPF
jgi:single-strand DNA-binding protein